MSHQNLNHSKSDEHLASNNKNSKLSSKLRIGGKEVECDLSAMNGNNNSGQIIQTTQTTSKCNSNNNNSGNSVKRKFRSLTFGRRKKSLSTVTNKSNTNNSSKDNGNNNEQTSGKKKNRSSVWAFKLCARTDSCCDVANADTCATRPTAQSAHTTHSHSHSVSTTCASCICTGYNTNNDEHHRNSTVNTNNINNNNIYNESNSGLCALFNASAESSELLTTSDALSYPNVESGIVSAVNNYHNATLPTGMMSEVRSVQVRVSELALALRSQLALTVSPYPYLARWGEVTELTPGFLNRFCIRDASILNQTDGQLNQQIHTQIDYIHCLVPDLLDITNCSFYWGKMDRYEAERLLENKPEGTFLLRDSAQEEHLFSVSFRRFDRSLHARIEQWNHRFSFDSHDPGVYSSPTVCGLIEHYKDPSHCMFFEPMLTIPLHRNFPFSLQHMCRTTICSRVSYDSIQYLQLPKRLKNYLKEYHYKQQVRVRRLDGDH